MPGAVDGERGEQLLNKHAIFFGDDEKYFGTRQRWHLHKTVNVHYSLYMVNFYVNFISMFKKGRS